MWTAWMIAVRFLRDGRGQTILILFGITIGVAVIVFVTALISGLQANIIARTLGTQAHITLHAPDEVNHIAPAGDITRLTLEDPRPQRLRSINNWQHMRDLLDTDPMLDAVSPLVSGPAFAQRGNARRSVALIGMDPERYLRVIPVDRDMVAGRFQPAADKVVIGHRLATELGLRPGDRLRIDAGNGRTATVDISGIFELGVRELDERYVYMDLKQVQTLIDLPGGVTTIDLTVADIFDADAIAARIGGLTGLKSESWMETNAQLMNALAAQRLSTRMISFFVAVSVAFGIASVLSVSVVQRTRQIGILRAMGAGQRQMLLVFVLQGALLGMIGAITGSICGVLLIASFDTFGPGLFEVSVTPGLIAATMVLATTVGALAASQPARRAARLDPVTAIRNG
ncbi:MAG: ABC transporter permease [Gammaproteobacteria bacterium]|jgi:lipoprotein-releasing system permease protein|nr:ABC transporter permease [Gammaproteobacteria bacterium]